MASDLSHTEAIRYSRQMVLPELGTEGQQRLKNARVLIVGAGALGSPALYYLAAAGVGHLVIADADTVDTSNLHRQIVHRTSTIGTPKSASALAQLRDLNPEIEITARHERLTPDNATSLVEGCDLIVDGCDNFPTRFLTCDLGFFSRIPVIHGAIQRFEGQVSVFHPHGGGPCYRCLLPTLPAAGSVPSCQEAGVIGALPGIIGSYMAIEAIKMLTGIGSPLMGRLHVMDALHSESRTLLLRKDPECALCGEHPTIPSIRNRETQGAMTCASDTDSIDARSLLALINQGADILIIDVRQPEEHAECCINNSISIPLADLGEQHGELPRDRDIILHCKSGLRSARALDLLKSLGFQRVRNLQGGIDAWHQMSS